MAVIQPYLFPFLAIMQYRSRTRACYWLKTKALEGGIPYQTLVSSILYRYITDIMLKHMVIFRPAVTCLLQRTGVPVFPGT
jgi:hypothetical protein